jgi:broad specificity phosphatase PhoE
MRHRVALPLIPLLLLTLLAGSAGGLPHPVAAQTTVVLVRHAEKAPEPKDDPPLSAAGQARARVLADALRDAGVTAVVTTQLARTRETAAPLATARGLAPQVVGTGGAAGEHASAVAAAVRRQPPGSMVLVVGHSNTVPAIIGALGGPRLPQICDAEYANLYVMTLDARGGARLVRTKYGAADPASPECGASMRMR